MTQKGWWLWTICIIGILIIVGAAIKGPRGIRSEPFQDLNYKTLNVSYDKEVYVITRTFETQADAAAACKENGGELATLAQMKRAQDASANWCNRLDQSPAAWTKDSTTNIYYPSGSGGTPCSPIDPCDTGVAPCVKRVAVTAGAKKYAACYGTKPPEQSAILIGYFDPTHYSIFDTDLLALTMNGSNLSSYESTMGLVFSPSQALYGLDQTYAATNTDRYSPIRARAYLATNLATLNTSIRLDGSGNDTAGNEVLAQWANGKQKTCDTLGVLQSDLSAKVQQVKNLIDKVNAYTDGAISAKNENIDLQQEVAYVCRSMTAATSPACKRLAEIDYEVYFKSVGTTAGASAKVLADLENLNMTLYSRQCEIRLAARQIQILSKALSCDQQGFQYNAATLGENFIQAIGQFYPMDPSDPCNDLSGNSQYSGVQSYLGKADTRFTAGRDAPYVNSELLKLSLEQISPYFDSAGYSDLFEQILNSLSFLLRIPSLNDYSTTTSNIDGIQKTLETITKSIPSIWSQSV